MRGTLLLEENTSFYSKHFFDMSLMSAPRATWSCRHNNTPEFEDRWYMIEGGRFGVDMHQRCIISVIFVSSRHWHTFPTHCKMIGKTSVGVESSTDVLIKASQHIHPVYCMVFMENAGWQGFTADNNVFCFIFLITIYVTNIYVWYFFKYMYASINMPCEEQGYTIIQKGCHRYIL